MHMVAHHTLEAAGGEDRRVEGVVGAVDDSGGNVTSCDSDGGEEGSGGDDNAVALVGADEVVGGVGVFSGVREGRD